MFKDSIRGLWQAVQAFGILNTDRKYSSGILAPSQLIAISKPDLLF